MTPSILLTTSLLMASSSGLGDMKLKKSTISSCSLTTMEERNVHIQTELTLKIIVVLDDLLPVDARAVAPGFPHAARGVSMMMMMMAPEAVGQQRVEAVEGVGPVQVPPAAGRMGLVVLPAGPRLVSAPGGGVAARTEHAAAVLLLGGRRRGRVLLPEVVLVQPALAEVYKLLPVLRHVQVVHVQRGAAGRGALGLRVQRGGGRGQRALPPDAPPLTASPRQFPEHEPRWRRYVSAELTARVHRVRVLHRKVALVVRVVVNAGIRTQSLRGPPEMHPQRIDRSLLFRLDPNRPEVHSESTRKITLPRKTEATLLANTDALQDA